MSAKRIGHLDDDEKNERVLKKHRPDPGFVAGDTPYKDNADDDPDYGVFRHHPCRSLELTRAAENEKLPLNKRPNFRSIGKEVRDEVVPVTTRDWPFRIDIILAAVLDYVGPLMAWTLWCFIHFPCSHVHTGESHGRFYGVYRTAGEAAGVGLIHIFDERDTEIDVLVTRHRASVAGSTEHRLYDAPRWSLDYTSNDREDSIINQSKIKHENHRVYLMTKFSDEQLLEMFEWVTRRIRKDEGWFFSITEPEMPL